MNDSILGMFRSVEGNLKLTTKEALSFVFALKLEATAQSELYILQRSISTEYIVTWIDIQSV